MKKGEWERRKEKGEIDEGGVIGNGNGKGSTEVGEAYVLRTAKEEEIAAREGEGRGRWKRKRGKRPG